MPSNGYHVNLFYITLMSFIHDLNPNAGAFHCIQPTHEINAADDNSCFNNDLLFIHLQPQVGLRKNNLSSGTHRYLAGEDQAKEAHETFVTARQVCK